MPRPITADEADELVELWARLDRLKAGIGGSVLQVVVADYSSPEQGDAGRRVRRLIAAALDVREQIRALTGTPPGSPPAAPRTPADGVVVPAPVAVAPMPLAGGDGVGEALDRVLRRRPRLVPPMRRARE